MIQNYHIMNIKGYKSILSLAACTLLGTSVYAQSWKQEAVNCLNNGEFAKVEQIIGSLKKKEKKQKHAYRVHYHTSLVREATIIYAYSEADAVKYFYKEIDRVHHYNITYVERVSAWD